MQYIDLGNSVSIPIIGFGTWQISGDEGYAAVQHALSVGYRHIDTAKVYGNQKEVGQAIRDSDVDRTEIFLTSKLWRESLRADDARKELEQTLDELNVSHLDLYLIHWPNKDVPIDETLSALERERANGTIRAIGVSNFTRRHIDDALATDVPVVNNQIEYHPTLVQDELVQYCQDHGVSVTAYSPIGRTNDLDHQHIRDIAARYERTPAQVILNWEMSKNIIVVPRSSNPVHIEENLGATGWSLATEDIEAIDALDRHERLIAPPFHEFDDT